MTRKYVRRVAPPAPDPVVDQELTEAIVGPVPVLPPPDWRKGALLNVRNRGEQYTITLYPEEWDPRHPERAIHFTNLGECQNFISRWYAPEHHDPRAR